MKDLLESKIAVRDTGLIFHGSYVRGIGKLRGERGEEVFKLLSDYMGACTLGEGVYFTDNRQNAINYAFYREKHEEYIKEFLEKNRLPEDTVGCGPTLYTVRPKVVLADLDRPENIDEILPSLLEYCEEKREAFAKKGNRNAFTGLMIHARNGIENPESYKNSRHLAEESAQMISAPNITTWVLNEFVKSQGFGGLICTEGGELGEGVIPWKSARNFCLYDGFKAAEVINEEHLELKDGKVVCYNPLKSTTRTHHWAGASHS
ncbi:hypothetical protein KY359_04600 [Candidatus Woesearchaeota archaeon]|nr:hypothetical protein [Candidatus Woesearchaeota archaeon]